MPAHCPISDTAPAPVPIQNASDPAAPARTIRTGLSNMTVPLCPSSTTTPMVPPPITARSGTTELAATENAITESAGRPETAAVPAGKTIVAFGAAAAGLPAEAPSAPSTTTAKSPVGGNVPLTSDRSMRGASPVTLRTTVSAVSMTGAAPEARTDTAAALMSMRAGASLALPARSANAPLRMSITPDAPLANAGEPTRTRRDAPEPCTSTISTACEPTPMTARPDASTDDIASSKYTETADSPDAAADTALGACPSDTARPSAPPNR